MQEHHTHTSTGPGAPAGEKVGTRVRGAFETLHGIGETLRGNALSAVDAAAGEGPNHNDEIARRGEREARMGMQDLSSTSNAQSTSASGVTGRQRTGTAVPTTNAAGMAAPMTTSAEAHHHRDDAISGLPPGQTRELQGRYGGQGGSLGGRY